MQTRRRMIAHPFRQLFLIALFILNNAVLIDAACTCINSVSNLPYPSDKCCDLGSVTCDSSMQKEAICVKDGQTCPRTINSNAIGHFISASMSWRATGGNSVEFEILSTWRLSFSWPYPVYSKYTGPCGFPGVGDVVPIVGISADSGSDQPLKSSTGNVAVQLLSGEPGKSYDLVMKVTSLSVEEDWISGISTVPITYPTPYAGKVPFFPSGMGKYVASKGTRDSLQPYQAVPWVATFSGCCRQFQTYKADKSGSWNFNLTAYVDLSDSLGSPRIVSLPQLWIDAPNSETDVNAVSYVTLCAISTAGVDGMYHRSHGTLNYPNDDNQAANMIWEITESSGGASWASAQPKVSNCRTLSINQASTYFRDQYSANQFTNSISIGVSVGKGCYYGRCNFATIDLSLFRYASRGLLPTQVASSGGAFTCTQATDGAYVATQGLPLNSSIGFSSGCLDMAFNYRTPSKALELRYVAALPERQSTQLATAPGRLQYSLTLAGQDHAGLPPSAKLSAAYGFQDIKVAFSASSDRVRPLQDVAVSAAQRDYASAVGALDAEGAALRAAGYSLIPGTNFNAGDAGGATVGLYALNSQIMVSSPALTPAAVTAVRLVNQSLVVVGADGALACPAGAADGFELVPRNLLEESNRGGIYLLIKRGSGPPIVSMSVDPSAAAGGAAQRWSTRRAESWKDGRMVASVTLFYQTASEATVQRTLQWTPCTSPTEMVFCTAAAERQDPSGVASTAPTLAQSAMTCAYFAVGAKPPPRFARCDLFGTAQGCPDVDCDVCGFFSGSAKVGATYVVDMGATMTVPIVLKNQAYIPWDIISVTVAPTSGIRGTTPADGNRTGPSGAEVFGYDANNVRVANQLFPSSRNADNPDRSVVGGYISWQPSPADGAWKGPLCVQACVPAAASCPSDGSSDSASMEPLCSTYCVQVEVGRCRWVVQAGDTLSSIAAAFKTNWLQLWYLNPKIPHPDSALSPVLFPQVAVGRLYRAQWDDTMDRLYRRFAITAEDIIALNADVAHLGPDQRFGDQTLCIIPNSCQDPTSTQGAQPF